MDRNMSPQTSPNFESEAISLLVINLNLKYVLGLWRTLTLFCGNIVLFMLIILPIFNNDLHTDLHIDLHKLFLSHSWPETGCPWVYLWKQRNQRRPKEILCSYISYPVFSNKIHGVHWIKLGNRSIEKFSNFCQLWIY